MKLVKAIIKEQMLDRVRQALIDAEISRITVTRVSGHGKQQGKKQEERIYRGKKMIPKLIPKVKLEIAVNDELVDTTVDTILESAVEEEEPQIGSGKIFITPLEECIRIRTRERGDTAI